VAGDAALLVDPLDVDALAAALAQVMVDEGLRRRLVGRGFQRIQRFSWRRCAQETWQVLADVLGPGSSQVGYGLD
jgi:glycosyltransferase involved in cell wall biosynthesis